jgi:A/G-specific adenine glycosylase
MPVMSPARRTVATSPDFAGPVLAWFARAARELPWRDPDAGPWAVLVSEIMLQQTPVNRVLPAYAAWLSRWPTPAALAAEAPGEAVRMWGKLGYPRRALRLHACAVAITSRFDGRVPDHLDDLLALPGVGAYTARAVASFAFGQRHPVVDTNVRRVLARSIAGQGEAGPPAVIRDHAAVEALLPDDPATAARFGVAVMELGALVCTARAPNCPQCPISDRCTWLLAGSPRYVGPSARKQAFAGTDRQVRGLLLDVLRGADGPVTHGAMDLAWSDPGQRARALDTLIADGLVEPLSDGGGYALPGDASQVAPAALAPARTTVPG